MENGVVLQVQGLKNRKDEDRVTREISEIPGIEFVKVDAHNGTVIMTGGDMDKIQVADKIEALGYAVFF